LKAQKLSRLKVLLGTFGASIIIGTFYCWSIISKQLVNVYGWTSSQATLPYTFFTVFMAISFCIGGRIQDRIGPKKCIAFCALLMGIGLVFCGVFAALMITDATKISLLVVLTVAGFGVIQAIGIGVGNVASVAPPQKWYPARMKGLITGLVLAGVGLSSIMYSFAANWLVGSNWPIAGKGVANLFLIMGVFSIITMYIASRFTGNPPEGYDKESGKTIDAAKAAGAKKKAGENKDAAQGEYTSGQIIKTAKFWVFVVMYALATASGLMLYAHAAPIANAQVNWSGGLMLVVILSILNVAGRILGGFISDKLGRSLTIKLAFIVQAINMLLFTVYTSIALMILGIAILGFCYGVLLSVFPTTTSDFWGQKNFGANYGVMFFGWGVGGIIGPMIAASIYDSAVSKAAAANSMTIADIKANVFLYAKNSYNNAYYIAAAITVVALVLTFVLDRLKSAPKAANTK